MKTLFKTTITTLASMLLSGALVQTASANNATVTVGPGGAYTFDPPTVSISVGDSVTWNWGSPYHSSTSGTADGTADGLWDSGVSFSTPFSYSHTFTQAGTYPYFCQYHYYYSMVGEVDVSGAVAQTPPTLGINAPKNGAVLAAPANVSIQASVTNGSGPVTSVQFRVNNNLLATQSAGPFSATTNIQTAGAYTLTAIAQDGAGLAATNSVAITVITPGTVSLTNGSQLSGTHFQFAYSADIGLNYVVQRSTDMMTWIPLATNKAASTPVIFDDPNATNGLDYYRVGRMPNP